MNKIEIQNLASIKNRIKAFIIDDLLITFLVVVMLWDNIANSGGEIMQVAMIINQATIQVILIKFLYQSFFIWYYGATLGKIVARLKVVDLQNNRVTLIGAINRSFFRIISESILYIGFIIANFKPNKQTLHDFFAKTLVVNA